MRRPARTSFAPVPRRIPALRWRRPLAIWTPAALALALGWPALLLSGQNSVFQAGMIAAAAGTALAITSLGAAWALGRAPRARRNVIRHMVWSGAIVAAIAPFVLASLIGAANPNTGLGAYSFVIAPVTIMLGLPIALFSGIVFSLVALVKPTRLAPEPPPETPAPTHKASERVRELS